ncbi:YrrS family protein [Evansella sp. AB-rgal1]|uniref:YrrS family protein n=1 Tax=Evansella sp. AB-rgal1 TaxID=3242696 RepID=UPI00359E70DF
MNQYGSYGPRRTDIRKKKRANVVLNVSIAVVAAAIVFVGGLLIFGGKSEPASVADNGENQEENVSNDVNENQHDNNELDLNENENGEEENEEQENEEQEVNESSNDVENNDSSNNEDDSETIGEVRVNEWNPIGTVQEEPFTAVFNDSSHVNWEEMTKALEYAIGVEDGERMTIWRLGNGGDLQSAVGYVATTNHDNPYKVRLEWVENKGWMPVSVEQVEGNPYR